jgi:hypothetical protein
MATLSLLDFLEGSSDGPMARVGPQHCPRLPKEIFLEKLDGLDDAKAHDARHATRSLAMLLIGESMNMSKLLMVGRHSLLNDIVLPDLHGHATSCIFTGCEAGAKTCTGENCVRVVSRTHCLLFFDATGTQWYVDDMESTNGVYINDRCISDITPLHTGDVLQLGGPFYIKNTAGDTVVNPYQYEFLGQRSTLEA